MEDAQLFKVFKFRQAWNDDYKQTRYYKNVETTTLSNQPTISLRAFFEKCGIPNDKINPEVLMFEVRIHKTFFFPECDFSVWRLVLYNQKSKKKKKQTKTKTKTKTKN